MRERARLTLAVLLGYAGVAILEKSVVLAGL